MEFRRWLKSCLESHLEMVREKAKELVLVQITATIWVKPLEKLLLHVFLELRVLEPVARGGKVTRRGRDEATKRHRCEAMKQENEAVRFA